MKETLTLHKDIVGVKAEKDDKLKAKSPLFWWNNSIQKLTKVDRVSDIAPVYTILLSKLDEGCYDGKLKGDPKLHISSEAGAAL